MESGVASADV